MSYTMQEVDEAEKRIRREFPGARIMRADYDFGLSVAKPDLSGAYVVFRPEREGQDEVVADLDEVITALKAPK